MEITLNNQDIQDALLAYVGANMNVTEGKTLQVNLSATRNPAGFKATVEFIDADSIAGATASVAKEEKPTKAKKDKPADKVEPGVKVDEPKDTTPEDVNDDKLPEATDDIQEAEASESGGLFDD